MAHIPGNPGLSPCSHGAECSCGAGEKIPLEKIIARCDELFNAEQPEVLGEHLRYWCSRARSLGDKPGELSLLSELMGHYRMQGDAERGREAVREGLALLKELDLETPAAGTILINAATALQSFGEIDGSLELYVRSACIYERHLDPGDLLFAGLFNNMAAAYAEKGAFKEAEYNYLRALDILKENDGLMDSAVTFLNLGQLYRKWGNDLQLAEAMVQCSWECFNAPGVVKDGYYAHTCRKCASGFGALGRGDLEKELNSRADGFYAGA